MRCRILLSLFIVGFLIVTQTLSSQNVVLSGLVTDASTGEPLIGVTVYNTDRRTGTTTNTTGHYTITLPSNRSLELVFSYVGYASETQVFTLTDDKKLDIQLRQDTRSLSEVEVYGTRHSFGAQSSQMSAVAVSAEQIRRMPVLLGETDVLKSLQRLPGVQSSGEGRAGIYVRGGGQDENLFSLDGITLYNPEHLQGFTSAINAEVVDDVVLYKGAFPARYGGRLSSVVDVSLLEGDFEKHRASITAGMLASRFQVDGPLWKGHTSYNIAARVSYFSAIVKPMLEELIYDNPEQMNNFNRMRYWDVNAKLTHKFSDNDKLTAVFYMGNDENNATPNESSQHFEFKSRNRQSGTDRSTYIDNTSQSKTLNNWRNLLGGLLYTHTFSSSMRLEAGASYSGYNSRLTYESNTGGETLFDAWGQGTSGARLLSRHKELSSSSYHSDIQDLEGKVGITYTLQGRHELYGGIQAGSQWLSPTMTAAYSSYVKSAVDGMQDDFIEREENRENIMEDNGRVNSLAAYIGDDWSVNGWLKTDIGLRLQGYLSDGETHLSLEPRASLRLMISKGSSIKASYSRMSQGIFLLSSGSLVNPSDIWIPMYKGMKPGFSDQLSMGYSLDMRKGAKLSVEAYYKWMDNVVDYREGSSALSAKDWSGLTAQGRGRAYGVELLAQKTVGNTTGQVSYTWSKSLRTFDREGMVLNDGREFYSTGDRRHNFNISITQRLSKNWDLSAAWTYQSGRRASFGSTTMTGPVLDSFDGFIQQNWQSTGQVDYMQNPAYQSTTADYYTDSSIGHVVRMNTYRQRNAYVLPAVHRLDVSLRHHGSIGIGEMICDIGIYNLYNQQNISTVYWGYDKNRRVLKGVCMFPVMPSISLTLNL